MIVVSNVIQSDDKENVEPTVGAEVEDPEIDRGFDGDEPEPETVTASTDEEPSESAIYVFDFFAFNDDYRRKIVNECVDWGFTYSELPCQSEFYLTGPAECLLPEELDGQEVRVDYK